MPKASSSPISPMFKVPHIMRMAHPEAFQPFLFHLGPYAPKFFDPLTGFSGNSSRNSSADAVGLPLMNGECSLPSSILKFDHGSSFQESMARDMTGDAAFEFLVGKLSKDEDNVLKQITDMYPELPSTMFDAIPIETLAMLFASSALIIVGSALSLLRLDLLRRDYHVHVASPADVPGAPPTTMRHPFINLLYALRDAVRMMENQVPVSLLKLACETFCHDKCRLRRLLDIPLDVSVEIHLSDVMRLLVQVLWKCLTRASPFYLEDQMKDGKQLEKIASWIERNTDKSVMAYIYDSLTGKLSDADEAADAEHKGIQMPTPSADEVKDDVRGDDYRMMSASQLRRYGVTFHTCTDVTGNKFKSITYNRKTRKLVLPTMVIWDDIQPILCNLMAYEATLAVTLESYGDKVDDVSSFVFFLDCLIDKEEDVELLVKAGVLRNSMARNNASVAKVFDGIDRSLFLNITREIKDILKELRNASNGRWWGWWVSFKETYWERQPWLLISMAAATVLLLLTTLQTIYTARS